MHVGEHRHADLILHFLQDAQTFFQAQTTEAARRGTVGLVEGGFIDEGNTQARGDFLQLTGGVQRELFALDHTRSGNQEQWPVQTGLEMTQLHAWATCAACC